MANSPISTVSNNPTGSIFNLAFLQGAGERAIKTGAQSVLAILTANTVVSEVPNVNALAIDWQLVLATFLGGVFFSIVFSVANPQFVAGTQAVLRAPEPVGGVSTPALAGLNPAQEPVTSEVVPAAPTVPAGSTTAG